MGKKTHAGNWQRTKKVKDEPLVLVGFGSKLSLKDLWVLKGTADEEELLYAVSKYGPRYRKASSCTEEEIILFKEYLKYVHFKLTRMKNGQ